MNGRILRESDGCNWWRKGHPDYDLFHPQPSEEEREAAAAFGQLHAEQRERMEKLDAAKRAVLLWLAPERDQP